MSIILLITVGIILAMVPLVLILSTSSVIVRIIAVIFALGFAAFCGFGFLASFELSAAARWPWQVAYGVLGGGALVTTALLLLWRGAARTRTDRQSH